MSIVVWRGKYAAIKQREKLVSTLSPAYSLSERIKHGHYETAYDVWTWNVWKMKWTRMAQHGCDWATLSHAMPTAQEEDAKIDLMLARNAPPWKPAPLSD